MVKCEDFGGMVYILVCMKMQGFKIFKYGCMEVCMKLFVFFGVWLVFWMLGVNLFQVGWLVLGEIDVMEYVNDENKVYGIIYWQDNNGQYVQYGGNIVIMVIDWYVYVVEWDISVICWYVDGIKYYEVNIVGGINGIDEFQKDFFLLLNFVVGGNWLGFNVDIVVLFVKMYVDYV